MKRRDAIKIGSALVGGMLLSGCGMNEKRDVNNNIIPQEPKGADGTLTIEPKQTAKYEYSSPMPFNEDIIDEIYNFNKTLKKGKIKVLYSSIPSPLGDGINSFFSNGTRGNNPNIATFDDYLNIIKYAMKKGFKCIYTLNTTMPIGAGQGDKIYQDLYTIFGKLQYIGVNDVKLSNPVLMDFFSKEFPNINIHLSTSTEYHSIQAYRYAVKTYPNIKTINIPTDENKNFEFLYALRQMFPNVKLELLVNETHCVKFCMSRYYHPSSAQTGFPCKEYIQKEPYLHFTRNTLVHPWEVGYHSAIGINNFKFTCSGRANIKDIDYMKGWIECVEKGPEKYMANDLLTKIQDGFERYTLIKFKDDYKLTELIKELPSMDYFVKYGAKCASNCGINCRYCHEISDKIKRISTYA